MSQEVGWFPLILLTDMLKQALFLFTIICALDSALSTYTRMLIQTNVCMSLLLSTYSEIPNILTQLCTAHEQKKIKITT